MNTEAQAQTPQYNSTDLVNRPQQDLHKNIEADTRKGYNDFLQQQQQTQNNEYAKKAAEEFEKVSNLGFATKRDLDTVISNTFNEYQKATEKRIAELEQKFIAAQELIFRARAQGLNVSNEDDTPRQRDPQDAMFERMVPGLRKPNRYN